MAARDYQAVTTDAEVDALVAKLLADNKLVSFDIETGYSTAKPVDKRALDVYHPDFFVVGFSITNDPSWSRYIPLRHDREQYLDPRRTWEAFRPVLEGLPVLAHHMQFEGRAMHELAVQGDADAPILFSVMHDSMIASHVWGQYKAHGLKSLSKEMLGIEQTEFYSLFENVVDETGKPLPKKQARFNILPVSPEVIHYACDDSALALELFHKIVPELDEGQRRIYRIEMQICRMMLEAAHFGIGVDWAGIRTAFTQYESFRSTFDANVRDQFAAKSADPDVQEFARTANYGSAHQMRDLLYTKLGMTTTRTTNSGALSTDALALGALARKEPAVKALLSLREMDNLGRRCSKWLKEYYGARDLRVHPVFSQTQVVSGRFSADSPAVQQCVPGDTEVLTPDGWVRFDDLDDGVPVAQFDPDTQGIDFVVPEVVRKPWSGDMVSLTMWGREFLFTPDHRILSQRRGRGSVPGAWSVDTASDWAEWGSQRGCRDRSFPRAGFKVGGRVLSSDERRALALAVCAQTDGYRHAVGAYDKYDVSVSKLRKADQLRALGLEVREYAVSRYRSGKRWRTQFSPELVSEWLDDEKKFKVSALLDLSLDDMRFFMSTVFQWDGDFTRKASYSQSLKNESAVHAVQAVAALSGFSTGQTRKNIGGHEAWQLTICDRANRKAGEFHPETVSWNGDVYCVQVPTSFFVIRRNRLVQITGNCPKDWLWSVTQDESGNFVPEGENGESYWAGNFRKFLVAGENKYLVTFDYSQIELRVLAGITQEPALLKAFSEGIDPHTMTTAMMLDMPVEKVTKKDRQIGKAQPLDAKVLTPTGWRLMGDLSVGDLVIGSDGSATRVTGVFPQGPKRVYQVVTSNGTTECCDEHLWSVRDSAVEVGSASMVKTLREIVDSGLHSPSGDARYVLPSRPIVQYEPGAEPLRVDPYLLGRLLIDPYFQLGDQLNSAIESYGLDYQNMSFVPDEYKRASAEDRTKIIDAICTAFVGHPYIGDSGYPVNTEQLAIDLQEIAQSLGGSGTVSFVDGEWHVKLSLPSVYLRNSQDLVIQDVIDTGVEKEMQCISVDADDHLYVTDSFIVTHNTINFGILYGMGPKRLAEQLAVSKEEADRLMSLYKSQFTKVATWDSYNRQAGVEAKHVRTWLGRYIPLWAAHSEDSYIRSGAERLAVNAQIQGGAADYVKLAMLRSKVLLQRAGLWHPDKVMLTMNQHDSLTFECDNSVNPNELRSILQEAVVFDAQTMFPGTAVPRFPTFQVDWELGRTWGGSVEWQAGVPAHWDADARTWVVDGAEPEAEVVLDAAAEAKSFTISTSSDDPPTLPQLTLEPLPDPEPEPPIVLEPISLSVRTYTVPEKAGLARFMALVKAVPGDSPIDLTLGTLGTQRLTVSSGLTSADHEKISVALGVSVDVRESEPKVLLAG